MSLLGRALPHRACFLPPICSTSSLLCAGTSLVENRHRNRGWKKLHTKAEHCCQRVGREGKDMGRGISQPHDSCREDIVLHQCSLPSPNLPTGDLEHEQGISSTIHPLYWCHGKGKASRDGQPDKSQVPKWPSQSCSLSLPSPACLTPGIMLPAPHCSRDALALHGRARGSAEQLPWGSQPPTLRLGTPHNQRRIIASESLRLMSNSNAALRWPSRNRCALAKSSLLHCSTDGWTRECCHAEGKASRGPRRAADGAVTTMSSLHLLA